MKSKTAQNFVSFLVGVIFAIGLAIAGMTQPQKVISFLDPWNWDPALLFVMMGAVGVHALLYPFVRRRSSPLLDSKWHISTRNDLTPRLIIGSAIFGVGWGMGGFCPGPGVVSLVTGDLRAVTFVVTMVFGMLVFIGIERMVNQRS